MIPSTVPKGVATWRFPVEGHAMLLQLTSTGFTLFVAGQELAIGYEEGTYIKVHVRFPPSVLGRLSL